MGIYGVSIFFILSGLSMAIVYHHFFKTIRSAGYFFIRRIFRIWPLLIFATLATILLTIHKSPIPSFEKILLNCTAFFGFVNTSEYIATGAWSIGNEFVYYAFTPFIIWSYNYKLKFGNLILLLSAIVAVYFAFSLLNPNQTLAQQWNIYINPFNNLFLYVVGIGIYYNLNKIHFSNFTTAFLILFSIIGFIFYPAKGDQITIVTGLNRVVFIILSIILVIGFSKFKQILPIILSYPLEKLGIVTYGVYILHPIIKSIINGGFILLGISNPIIIVVVSILSTILFSLVSYYAIELKLTKYAKRITS